MSTPSLFSELMGQEPISIGKFIFDEAEMQWTRSATSAYFPQALTGFLKSYEDEANQDNLLKDNHMMNDQITLNFAFNLPVKAVSDVLPKASYQLRTVYQPIAISAAKLKISVGSTAIGQASLANKGRCVQETFFDHRIAKEGQIVYKLDQGIGKLYLHEVELLVNPGAPADSSAGSTIQKVESGGVKSQRSAGSIDYVYKIEASDQNLSQTKRGHSSRLRKGSKSQSQLFTTGAMKQDIEDEDIEEEDIDIIKQAHEKNNIMNNLDSYESQQAYQKLVEFRIPLKELYEIDNAIVDVGRVKFCAIQIRIQDAEILKINNGLPWLLQIWKIGGVMLLEKPLRKPVCNWQLNQDKFLFQENVTDPEIYMVDLFEDHKPQVYKFLLPEHLYGNAPAGNEASQRNKEVIHRTLMGQENVTEYDLFGDKEALPMASFDNVQDQNMYEEFNSTRNQNQVHGLIDKVKSAQPGASVLELFDDDKICNKEPAQLLDVVIPSPRSGVMVFARNNKLFYFDFTEHLLNTQSDQVEKEVVIKESELRSITVKEQTEIVSFAAIDDLQSCIVTENRVTHEIDFFAYKIVRSDDGKLSLSLCGMSISDDWNKREKRSKLVKVCSSVIQDKETKKFTQITLILRKNGSVEIYNDFILKNCLDDKKLQCVDISAGQVYFFFKMIKNSHLVTADTDPQLLWDKSKENRQIEVEYHYVAKTWENRIGAQTIAKDDTELLDEWKEVIHKRVSSYVKLYNTVTNFSTFMILSHRNLLSIYDLGVNSRWVDTVKILDDSDNHIRKMQIKKRPQTERHIEEDDLDIIQTDRSATKIAAMSIAMPVFSSIGNILKPKKEPKYNKARNVIDKFEIACLFGANTLAYVQVNNKKGLFERHAATGHLKVHKLDIEARVIQLVDDKTHAFGMTLLTDNGPKEQDFLSGLGCKIYNFPLSSSKTPSQAKFVFKCVKMREIYDLMSSDEEISENLISHTCSFGIRLTSRSQFKKKGNYTQKEQDEFYKAFPKKDVIIKTLSLTSLGKTKIFPLQKTRDQNSKTINKIQIIKLERHTRTLELQQAEDDQDGILEAFYATHSDFLEHRDSYFRITRNKIHIFDSKGTHFMTYNNLAFQQVIHVEQSFLYATCDAHSEIQRLDADGVVQQKFQTQQDAGVYVYDTKSLLRGTIQPYKVSAQGLGGQGTLIQHNVNKGRISFMEDYNTVIVMPVPQQNIINFGGMKNKHEYLIWREKNGFFTALDRQGDLCTWSQLTGRLLYTLNHEQDDDASEQNLGQYQVYRSTHDDITYTRDAYRLDDRSLCLLRGNKPLPEYEGTEKLRSMDFVHGNQIFGENKDCHIEAQKLKFDTYHLKVMKLQTYEDTKDVDTCKVLFHFDHPLIRKTEEEEGEKSEGQLWDFEKGSIQRLYLSQDTRKLLEVIDNEYGVIYSRQDVDKPDFNDDAQIDRGQKVKWVLKHKLSNWPSLLCKWTSAPFIFSDNFTYRFDFDHIKEQLLIRKISTGEEYVSIPIDMINTEWPGLNPKDAIDLIFSRMKWCPAAKDGIEHRIRIVTQANLDCIFEICLDKKKENRKLKLISVCKIDNLHTDMDKANSPHYFKEPYTLQPDDVSERLIRLNQNYKTAMQHAINLKEFDNEKDFKAFMLEQVMTIDYEQLWGHINSYFAINVSFTMIDWLIIQTAINDDSFSLQSVSDQQKLQLMHNIFPDGKGILHMLSLERQVNQSHIIKLANQIFEMTKEPPKVFLHNVDKFVQIEVPFLYNLQKQTALDICLDNQFNKRGKTFKSCMQSPLAFFGEIIYSGKIADFKKDETNIMLADLLLQNIAPYGQLHCSQLIIDALIEGTRMGLPGVKSYMDSRIGRTEHARLSLSHKKIETEYLRECPAIEGEYGYVEAPMWGAESDLQSNLFRKSGSSLPTRFETIDLPEIFQQGERGIEFIEALTDCQDRTVFLHKSVQLVVDHHYYFWYKINLYSIVVPAFAQVIIFWGWNNFVLTIRLRTIERERHDTIAELGSEDLPLSYSDEDEFNVGDLNVPLKFLLSALTLYLLCYDFSVFLTIFSQKDFKGSLKVLITMILHILVIKEVASADDEHIVTSSYWQNQSWVALAIWMRTIVEYLGKIKEFSWLVGLIKFSASYSLYFITVFILGVTAFADSFNALEQRFLINNMSTSEPMTQEALALYRDTVLDTTLKANFNRWLTIWQTAFFTSVGDFNGDELAKFSYLDWIIFFVLVFFLIILMLNLLISVIAEAQGQFTDSKIQNTYREKAKQIRQSNSSFFGFFYLKPHDITSLLYFVQQASTNDQEDGVQTNSQADSQLEQLTKTTQNIQDMLIQANDEAVKPQQ